MSRPADSPFIAWMDLETTGTEEDALIVEASLVITDRLLDEVEAHNWVVHADHAVLASMQPYVYDMHTASGLLDEALLSGLWISDVDREAAAILRRLNGGGHVPLAGSGVCHFDRRYIRRHMPRTDRLLSYWSYDIGSLRRLLELAGIEVVRPIHPGRQHRALDDARWHIAETKHYFDLMRARAA